MITYHYNPLDWVWWVRIVLEDVMYIFYIVIGIAAIVIARHVKRFADTIVAAHNAEYELYSKEDHDKKSDISDDNGDGIVLSGPNAGKPVAKGERYTGAAV